ncbi:hypothetical protein MLD38_024297 [Melastoma candidum]|uniref:Uncharacterized protein n=1 Tax=Melastoma candidum TaxID=119954 RepID=A0ACB9NRV2_9MYRT|nr:hypothetical protein MLD38_024297 [Melastoma candidum]
MGKIDNVVLLALFLLFFGLTSAASPTSPARIVNGLVSNAVPALVKWVTSLKATAKTATTGRPQMKFESGYTVETVFDGSKLGIEPHSVEVLPSGDLLILDAANSNLYKISSSLSLYSRPKLVAGSPDGYAGLVDGRPREAKMNHPKGLTVDDKGNIYIADTGNMAIRKISDSGVTTIAGGKGGRGGSHVDGPSEDAKFSDDFDVVYIGSSCSLLVIDRGNRAIREMQLHFDDCAYQYGSSFPLGIAVLLGAGFFGYMLALLQHRVRSIVSSQNEETNESSMPMTPYRKPLKPVRQPLIPIEGEPEKQDEGVFGSLGKVVVSTGTSALDILGGVFPVLRRKSTSHYPVNHTDPVPQSRYPNTWPVQDSYVIPDEDEPPSIETRDPTPKKTYPFMSKDAEKIHQLRQSRVFYNGWDDDTNLQQQQQYPPQKQNHHHHRYHSSIPHTYYEQSCENTKEIVFGAVQEQDRKGEPAVIKPVEYGHSPYDNRQVRTRTNSMGYIRGY